MIRLLVLIGQKLVVQGSQLLIFRYDYFTCLMTELFAAQSLVRTKVCTCFDKHFLHFGWHFYIAGSNDTTVSQMLLQWFFCIGKVAKSVYLLLHLKFPVCYVSIQNAFIFSIMIVFDSPCQWKMPPKSLCILTEFFHRKIILLQTNLIPTYWDSAHIWP